MPACPPFRLVPWDTDFLEALKNGIVELTEQQPGNAVVIVPHDRPKRYLVEAFKNDPHLPRPCLLPQLFTIRELMTALRQSTEQHARHEAGQLDQVALLLACVRDVAASDSELCAKLAATAGQGMDMAEFFPWGVLLAELLEECFTQGLVPDDLLYTEGEVAPFAAALLGSLGRLFARYKAMLTEQGLTTPGLEAFTAAEPIERLCQECEDAPLPPFLEGKHIVVAGYGTLTATEDTVFRHLWRHGAQIWLHVDPRLAETPFSNAAATSAKPHWACGDQARWIAAWGAHAELACPPSGNRPRIHYFAGYDLHSQLNALQEDLRSLPEPHQASQQDIAITLTHSDILLPVLHHLPRKDCNISLGYPLARSLLFRLLESILSLRDQRQPDGSTHWRPLTNLVCHPYLRLLEAEGIPLRDTLQYMERRLRDGQRFALPDAIAHDALNDTRAAAERLLPDSLERLLHQVLHATIHVWAKVSTLRELANALSTLCDLLLTQTQGHAETVAQSSGVSDARSEGMSGANADESLWTRFPLDAECLFRLLQRVIPALQDNRMADIPLSWPLLRAMLVQLIRAERVPFEADPLTGVQVLGMLETRLLRFPRLFIMDLTDDQLPGSPTHSPLLPDSLRTLLGLPDTKHREQLAAYTLHRLLAGAEEVWLYWQEGVESSGLFDGKKQRSRFVEELLWHEERRQGRRLKTGTPPLRTASLHLHPPHRERKALERTPTLHARMELFLKTPLSATSLDAYMTCPLRFYFDKLCGIKPLAEVREDDDHAGVGDLLHGVLREAYLPCLRQGEHIDLPSPKPEADTLRTLFATHLAASPLPAALPPESAAMLALAGELRLMRFLEQQPEVTEVIALEERFTAPLSTPTRQRQLQGLLDRVDWRTTSAPAPCTENEDAASKKTTRSKRTKATPNAQERAALPSQTTAPEALAVEEGAIILDYKTGRLKTLTPKQWQALWEDDAFWEALRPERVLASLEHPDPAEDLLPRVAKRIPSVQLLHYCYLYGQATGNPVLDAAFVALADDGAEHAMFRGLDPDLRSTRLEQSIPDLLRFLVLHMERCTAFRPQEGVHCRWCSWNNLCIMGTAAW